MAKRQQKDKSAEAAWFRALLAGESQESREKTRRDPYEGLDDITRPLGWVAQSERHLPSGVVPARGTDPRRLMGDRHSREPQSRDQEQ